MWMPDGFSTKARFGVLTPHLDPVPETELQVMAPAGVTIHSARVPLGMVDAKGNIVPQIGPEAAKAFSEPPEIDHAIKSLEPLNPTAIIYAFTSSSYIKGIEGDDQLTVRLSDLSGGIPIIIQSIALLSALRALDIKKIALIHPPWFTPELDNLGATYFNQAGFEVVIHDTPKLRADYGDIPPDKIYDWVKLNIPTDVEAIVIGGGGFRAIGVINELESVLGKPVITANQASLWQALVASGVEFEITGYGKIFEIKK
jgi:maleate isomerase